MRHLVARLTAILGKLGDDIGSARRDISQLQGSISEKPILLLARYGEVVSAMESDVRESGTFTGELSVDSIVFDQDNAEFLYLSETDSAGIRHFYESWPGDGIYRDSENGSPVVGLLYLCNADNRLSYMSNNGLMEIAVTDDVENLKAEIADVASTAAAAMDAAKAKDSMAPAEREWMCTTRKMLDDFAVTEALEAEWDSSRAECDLFAGNTNIIYGPRLSTPHLSEASRMFIGCSSMRLMPDMELPALQSANRMFCDCTALEIVGDMDMPLMTDARGMFENCSCLTSIGTLNTPNMTLAEGIFAEGGMLERVEAIDFKSLKTFVAPGCPELQSIVVKNIGKAQDATSFDFSGFDIWGASSDEAKTTLRDSLLRYSMNRAQKGWPAVTLKLSSTSYASLSAEDVSKISSRGYVLTT